MTIVNLTEFESAVPANAAAVAAVHGLAPDSQFQDTLNAISKSVYGDFSPDEADAPLRRVWGAELLGSLRSLADSAKLFSKLAENVFPGAAALAYADFVGSEHIEDLQDAVATLIDTCERDRPIRANRALIKIIVGILMGEWLRIGGVPSVEKFESFARLALHSRRDLPEPMFTGAILALTANWRVGNGAKLRSPLAYTSGDWMFISGCTCMGGTSDEVLADVPDDAKARAELWAQCGAAHIARYEHSTRAEKLVLIAHGCGNANPYEQIAFKCDVDTDRWAECEIPNDISRMLAWARFDAGDEVLPHQADSQPDI